MHTRRHGHHDGHPRLAGGPGFLKHLQALRQTIALRSAGREAWPPHFGRIEALPACLKGPEMLWTIQNAIMNSPMYEITSAWQSIAGSSSVWSWFSFGHLVFGLMSSLGKAWEKSASIRSRFRRELSWLQWPCPNPDSDMEDLHAPSTRAIELNVQALHTMVVELQGQASRLRGFRNRQVSSMF